MKMRSIVRHNDCAFKMQKEILRDLQRMLPAVFAQLGLNSGQKKHLQSQSAKTGLKEDGDQKLNLDW